jgi:hypothetical protein
MTGFLEQREKEKPRQETRRGFGDETYFCRSVQILV